MDKGKKKKYHHTRRKRLQIDNISKTANNSLADTPSAEANDQASHGPAENSDKPSTSTVPEVAAQQPGSSSPEPNCAICLGTLENRSFTDRCFHMFCFVCLVEWSKVKAECPLCKQSFKSIVHNVRSYEDYDQYYIPRPEDRERNAFTELATPSGIRFSYRTTVSNNRYAHLTDRLNQAFESRFLQRPLSPIPSRRRMRQPTHSDYRRSIYLQRLKPRIDYMSTWQRVRDISPSFYRENVAQTHRLVPWLNRELNALLQGHGSQVAFVLELIMGLIKRYPIDSEEFYQHVFPFTGRNTRKFMQEFLMFAKSPLHMAAYDRHVIYEPSQEPHHDSESDMEQQAEGISDDDSDVIMVSPQHEGQLVEPSSPSSHRMNTELDGFAPIVRSYGHHDLSALASGQRFIDGPSTSGWDSPTPGPSSLSWNLFTSGFSPHLTRASGRQTTGSNWTPSSSSVSAPSTPLVPPATTSVSLLPNLNSFTATIVHPIPSTSRGSPIELTVTDSVSNASDLEIIEVEKPWVERSPIQVSSGGESDFEIMITGTSHINDLVKKDKKKHKKLDSDRRKDSIDYDRKKDLLENDRKKDSLNDDRNKDSMKRSRDKSRDKGHKKRRHHSRSSGALPKAYMDHTRSKSRTPVQLTIFRSPDYQHETFSYRTHQDDYALASDRSSQRLKSFSSSTDSERESESHHLSITSREHKSTRHSRIEIVEYRKKSSKHSKSKKHKKDKGHDKKIDSLDKGRHHKKHKKDMGTANKKQKSMSKSGHSSSSHSKHKNKSKKKKSRHVHDFDERNKITERSNNEESQITSAKIDSALELRKVSHKSRGHVIEENTEELESKRRYTSDSESDSESDIDVLEIRTNDNRMEVIHSNNADERKKHGVDKSGNNTNTFVRNHYSTHNKSSELKKSLTSSNSTVTGACLEFSEHNSTKSACIDQELDSVNKNLEQNNFMSCLFGETVGENEKDVNASRMNNPNDRFIEKTFKKHPCGHKKSSKGKKDQSFKTFNQESSAVIQQVVEGNNLNAKDLTERSHFSLNHVVSNKSNGISSNDISSSSDLDMAKQLPSFCMFMTGNTSAISNIGTTNELNFHADADIQVSENLEKSSAGNSSSIKAYGSPTNSVHSVEKGEESDNFLFIPSYKTSKDNIKIPQQETFIDVIGENDSVEHDVYLNFGKKESDVSDNSASGYVDSQRFKERERDFLSYPSYKTSKTSLIISELESINDDACINTNRETDFNVNPKQGSSSNHSESDCEIDVVKDDSDIECSLIEGHKTFEIVESNSDDDEIINIIDCSDEEIDITGNSDIIEVVDKKPGKEVTGKEIVKLFVDSDLDMYPELDYNYDESDDVVVSGNSIAQEAEFTATPIVMVPSTSTMGMEKLQNGSVVTALSNEAQSSGTVNSRDLLKCSDPSARILKNDQSSKSYSPENETEVHAYSDQEDYHEHSSEMESNYVKERTEMSSYEHKDGLGNNGQEKPKYNESSSEGIDNRQLEVHGSDSGSSDDCDVSAFKTRNDHSLDYIVRDDGMAHIKANTNDDTRNCHSVNITDHLHTADEDLENTHNEFGEDWTHNTLHDVNIGSRNCESQRATCHASPNQINYDDAPHHLASAT